MLLPLPPPHLTDKIGQQRWTSKIEIANALSYGSKAEKGPEHPLVVPMLLFLQTAEIRAERLAYNFQLPNNLTVKQRN